MNKVDELAKEYANSTIEFEGVLTFRYEDYKAGFTAAVNECINICKETEKIYPVSEYQPINDGESLMTHKELDRIIAHVCRKESRMIADDIKRLINEEK